MSTKHAMTAAHVQMQGRAMRGPVAPPDDSGEQLLRAVKQARCAHDQGLWEVGYQTVSSSTLACKLCRKPATEVCSHCVGGEVWLDAKGQVVKWATESTPGPSPSLIVGRRKCPHCHGWGRLVPKSVGSAG